MGRYFSVALMLSRSSAFFLYHHRSVATSTAGTIDRSETDKKIKIGEPARRVADLPELLLATYVSASANCQAGNRNQRAVAPTGINGAPALRELVDIINALSRADACRLS